MKEWKPDGEHMQCRNWKRRIYGGTDACMNFVMRYWSHKAYRYIQPLNGDRPLKDDYRHAWWKRRPVNLPSPADATINPPSAFSGNQPSEKEKVIPDMGPLRRRARKSEVWLQQVFLYMRWFREGTEPAVLYQNTCNGHPCPWCVLFLRGEERTEKFIYKAEMITLKPLM